MRAGKAIRIFGQDMPLLRYQKAGLAPFLGGPPQPSARGIIPGGGCGYYKLPDGRNEFRQGKDPVTSASTGKRLNPSRHLSMISGAGIGGRGAIPVCCVAAANSWDFLHKKSPWSRMTAGIFLL